MKKLLMMISSVVLGVLSTSCLQQHTTVSVNKDGSGTITEETLLGAQMVAMMAQAGAAEGGDPMAQMLAQAETAAEANAKTMGEGVTVKEVKALDEDGKKGTLVVYAFEDINKVKYSFGQGMEAMGPGQAAGEEKEPMDFSYADGVLTLTNKYEEPEEAAAEGEDKEMTDQELAMAKQMMGDMQITLSVEAPGGIEETNAEYVEGNKVILMDMKMGKLLEKPEKFKEFNKQKPGSPAEAKKLLEGIEGIKIETAEKVTIKLK